MNLTQQAFILLIFLIPGFIASIIFDNLATRQEKKDFFRIIEALIFSFFIYGFTSITTGTNFLLFEVININENLNNLSSKFSPIEFFVLLVFSLIFPLLLSFLVTSDLHMKFFRKLKITNRTSRENVWLDIFNDQKRVITVNLKDSRRVCGWPMYYSEYSSEGQLYLYQPSWIDDSGNHIEMNIHGLFLLDNSNIESIEFTFNQDDPQLSIEKGDNNE